MFNFRSRLGWKAAPVMLCALMLAAGSLEVMRRQIDLKTRYETRLADCLDRILAMLEAHQDTKVSVDRAWEAVAKSQDSLAACQEINRRLARGYRNKDDGNLLLKDGASRLYELLTAFSEELIRLRAGGRLTPEENQRLSSLLQRYAERHSELIDHKLPAK